MRTLGACVSFYLNSDVFCGIKAYHGNASAEAHEDEADAEMVLVREKCPRQPKLRNGQ